MSYRFFVFPTLSTGLSNDDLIGKHLSIKMVAASDVHLPHLLSGEMPNHAHYFKEVIERGGSDRFRRQHTRQGPQRDEAAEGPEHAPFPVIPVDPARRGHQVVEQVGCGNEGAGHPQHPDLQGE